MAKLTQPVDAVQCNCGINIRQEEMVLDENPFENNTSYLLCPQCELALFMIKTDNSDKTQKPITQMVEMTRLKAQITKLIKDSKNRPGELKVFDAAHSVGIRVHTKC